MENSLQLIGKTPIYNIEGTNIYAKLEKYNLTGSIKDRAVLGMLEEAKRQGKLNDDTIVVEPTSGNTGISLAALGKLMNLKVVIVMSESMSIERRNLIKSYGAQVVLTPKELRTKGAIAKAEEIVKNNDNAIMLNQFDNPSNADYHYKTTAQEILEQVPDIDVFVAGVGTGGTFTGIARYLKENKKDVITVAVEPELSPAISKGQGGAHRIQGIGTGFIPGNFDRSVMDEVITVNDFQSMDEAINFMQTTGIGIGISSGAVLIAAKKLAKKYPTKKIVTIFADGMDKYFSVLKFPDVKFVEEQY